MTQNDSGFVGSIPEIYDTYLVPLIFEAYANDLAERTAALAPNRVLETAAGSGVLARALAPRLAPDARYFVTDLNQPMLDHAASKQDPIAASYGSRPTQWSCRSIGHVQCRCLSISASCFSLTGSRLIPKSGMC